MYNRHFIWGGYVALNRSLTCSNYATHTPWLYCEANTGSTIGKYIEFKALSHLWKEVIGQLSRHRAHTLRFGGIILPSFLEPTQNRSLPTVTVRAKGHLEAEGGYRPILAHCQLRFSNTNSHIF